MTRGQCFCPDCQVLLVSSIFVLGHNTFSGDEVDPIAAALAAKATVTVPAARAIVSFSRCAIFCSGELSSVSLSTALYLEGPALDYKRIFSMPEFAG